MTRNNIPKPLPNWILTERRKKKGKKQTLPFANRNIEEDRKRIKKSLTEFRFFYLRQFIGYRRLPHYVPMRAKIIEMIKKVDKDGIYFTDKDERMYLIAKIIDSFWYLLFEITNFDYLKYLKEPEKLSQIFLQKNPHLKDENRFLKIFSFFIKSEERSMETFLIQLQYDRTIIEKSIIVEANEKYIKNMNLGKYTLKDAIYDAVLEAILKNPRNHYLFDQEILLNAERTLRDYRSSLSKKSKKAKAMR